MIMIIQLFLPFRTKKAGDREKAQLAMGLPYKHEDLSSR